MQGLEAQRKEIVKVIVIGLISVFVLLPILVLLELILPAGIVFIAGVISIIIMCYGSWKKYRIAFKKDVVSQIVHLIDETWGYESTNHISESYYHSSKLFTKRADRYKGDDFVSGGIDKTAFQFSELHSEYKTTSTDSKGNRKTHWHTIFKGLFFHADFNKHLAGETLVLPDTAQRLFGKLGQSLQKMSGRGKLVKLENIEFEKEFVVYGADQIEPRYILTPVMMAKMLALVKKYGHVMHFSFIGSRVYCAMSVSKDMFEPRLFSSGVRFEDVQKMHDYFSFIEVIIQEMNLNTRIWTKVQS
ncbi:MAG: DUF3137 domain-containing protein [Cytophagales bacterium]|nr:DUF3137 domain-containing protein [Cytophagales bacterium]